MHWLILTILAISFVPLMTYANSTRQGGSRIQQQVEQRLAAGEKPNSLINEQSPYLLQHAFNPVDWYPWGDKAFARAQKEDKPIFLSIGYSTCHWCHVMAHESFENLDIAELLNSWFISIKVDREERPDIDQLYMAATQAMTGSGGWPMTLFLLPDGSPFYAGTYFPPTTASNRPGFKDLLTTIHRVWLERRGDIEKSAARMVAALETKPDSSSSAIKEDIFEQCYTLLERSYDPKEGGFGRAPKFPRPVVLSFLLSHYLATGEKKGRDMVLHTLSKMAAGGMYDQLGGGFHRYSVDGSWFVPHFEKMLYDQAQLVHAYLDGFQLSGEEEFARTAREILTYLLRDMLDPAGGFYSAEDADSEDPYRPGQHGEGAYFLWTWEDIVLKLGEEAAEIFASGYGVKGAGNVAADPMGEFTGRNILYRAAPAEEIAIKFGRSPEQVRESLQASKKLLFKERMTRHRPHLDDKVITAWNGMVIGALARASWILQEPQFLQSAIRTARFLENNLYDSRSHSLFRRYRNKNRGLAGQLSDYTYLVDGLLHLYQASQEPHWLKWAAELTDRQLELFWDKKDASFFDSIADPSVKVRMKSGYDGAEPAGNSVAAHNLIQLSQLLNRTEWREMARDLIESFSGDINRYPPALPLMLTAWRDINSKPEQVIIAGERGADDTKALLKVVASTFSGPRLVLLADGGSNQDYLAGHLPFMTTVAPQNGRATAYVCRDFTCRMPVTAPQELKELLQGRKAAPAGRSQP